MAAAFASAVDTELPAAVEFAVAYCPSGFAAGNPVQSGWMPLHRYRLNNFAPTPDSPVTPKLKPISS